VKARISVRLKEAILDPQGKAVLRALDQLGYDEVNSVRIGKLIELDIDSTNYETAQVRVEELSRKLLTNPLMENFECELVNE
jgi:phosphoribosylformylglycinamidine synthase subunit PurS